MPDPTSYASPDELGRIRVEQYQRAIAGSPPPPLDPAAQRLWDYGTQASQMSLSQGLDPASQRLWDYGTQAMQDRQTQPDYLSDLVRSGMKLQAASPTWTGQQPTATSAPTSPVDSTLPTEQDRALATQATQQASKGLLNTLLYMSGAPKRWVFDTLVTPAAKAVGLVAPDAHVEPEGRDLLRKAFGGDLLDTTLTNKLETLGLSSGLAGFVGQLPTRLGGLALDIALDPLMYVGIGPELGGIKAGGRVLSKEGVGLLNILDKQVVPSAAADIARMRDISGALAAKAQEAAQAAADVQRALVAQGRTPELVSRLAQATEEATNQARLSQKFDTYLDAGLATSDAARAQGLTLPADVEQYVRQVADPSLIAQLKRPEVDQAFSLLRGTGAGVDLFAPGGLHWQLPFNLAHLQVPLLNKEDQLGAWLFGQDITLGQSARFDDLRRTLIDLGGAALAKVPIPEAVSQTAERAASGVRWLFTPYSYLQGWGRGPLAEDLKTMARVPRSERAQALQEVDSIFRGTATPLEPRDLAQIEYLLGHGVMAPNEVETFDQFAARQMGYTEKITGEPYVQGARAALTAEDIAKRQIERRSVLQKQLETIAETDTLGNYIRPKPEFEFEPGIPYTDLGPLRPKMQWWNPATRQVEDMPDATALPAAEWIQRSIDEINTSLTNKVLPKRLDTADLVEEMQQAIALRRQGVQLAPTRLEDLGLSDNVLTILQQLLSKEAQSPLGSPGPVWASTQEALRTGQQSFTMNYLQNIHAVDAGGVAKVLQEQGRQLGERIPGNVNRQRVASWLAEPEVLAAQGYVTDPASRIAATLAQYRSMAREAEFVGQVLEDFGRPLNLAAGELGARPGWGVYDPKEWFTKRLPEYDTLNKQLVSFQGGGLLDDLEIQRLLALKAPRMYGGRKGSPAGELWLLPNDVLRGLQETSNVARNAGGISALVDAALAVQRSLVTVMWPAYHVRNMVGNLFNSALGGVSMSDTQHLAEAAQVLRGTTDSAFGQKIADILTQANVAAGPGAPAPRSLDALAETLRGAAPALGVRGTGQELPEAAAQTTEGTLAWFRKILAERGIINGGQVSVDTKAATLGQAPIAQGLSAFNQNQLFQAGRTASEMVDNVMRVRHVLAKLDQGSTLEEAVLSAKKVLFDFGDLSPAEKQFFRPTAFFYSWMRKNVPLQWEAMISRPRVLSLLREGRDTANDPDVRARADAALLPAHVREQLGIVAGENAAGQINLLTGLGLPIEDINTFNVTAPDQLVRQFLGITNPFIQTIAAAAGMPSTFTNRVVGDDSYQNYYRQLSPLYGQIASVVPGLGTAIGLHERTVIDANGDPQTVYSANPAVLFGLHNALSLGRVLRTVGQTYDVARNPTTADILKLGINTLTGAHITTADLSRPVARLGTSIESEAIDRETGQKLDEIARNLAGGLYSDPSTWRKLRSDILAQRENRRDQLLQQQLQLEQVSATPEQIAAIDKVRGSYLDESTRLLNQAYALDPTGINPQTQRPFVNAKEFATTRAAMLAQALQGSPDAAKRQAAILEQRYANLPPAAAQTEREYQQAVQLLAEYEKVPKYRNLTPEQADEVDALHRRFADLVRAEGIGPARADLRSRDPAAFSLMQRARLNTQARYQAWRQLNTTHGGLLDKYFGELTTQELAQAQEGGVPALASGAINYPGGPAIVGEAGPEQVQLPSGEAMTVTRPTLLPLPAGANVIPWRGFWGMDTAGVGMGPTDTGTDQGQVSVGTLRDPRVVTKLQPTDQETAAEPVTSEVRSTPPSERDWRPTDDMMSAADARKAAESLVGPMSDAVRKLTPERVEELLRVSKERALNHPDEFPPGDLSLISMILREPRLLDEYAVGLQAVLNTDAGLRSGIRAQYESNEGWGASPLAEGQIRIGTMPRTNSYTQDAGERAFVIGHEIGHHLWRTTMPAYTVKDVPESVQHYGTSFTHPWNTARMQDAQALQESRGAANARYRLAYDLAAFTGVRAPTSDNDAQWVTMYPRKTGQSNEDFAESVAMYLHPYAEIRDGFRRSYPNRAAMLDIMLGGAPSDAYPSPVGDARQRAADEQMKHVVG